MKHVLYLLVILCWHTSGHAGVTARIAPETAKPGEIIHLTLTQDENVQSGNVPDLTPLKKDFTLAGTEHNMSYTVINGVAKATSQWIFLLIPKTTGILTIPPLKMGQQYSQAIQVNVGANTNSSMPDTKTKPPEQNDVITIETEANPKKPYINQQILYTVKLAANQSLMDAQYQPPIVENALLIPLGEGRRYQTIKQGQEYSVDEQHYAIYPQKSGVLKITPPKLRALVYDNVPKRIHAKGNDIKISVQPVPQKDTNQPWLPAKQVTLSEQYDSNTLTVGKGNTLVRTITLRAVDLPAELLPGLPFTDNKQFSVYPEKPETQNVLRQQELIGTSTVKVTYLLNHAGQVTLPPISISWFNTQTGQPESATLPAREITVTEKPDSNTTPLINTPARQPQPDKSQLPLPSVNNPLHSLSWWVAGIFAFAWILTLFLWWLLRNRTIKPKNKRGSSLTNLRKACATHDPVKAHAALLNWSRQQWPDVTLFNLSELSALIHDVALKKQIQLLSQALYAQNNSSTWRGDALWHAVENYRPQKTTRPARGNALPPMNPGWNEK